MPEDESILTINGGSSSIKFSLYKIEDPLKQMFVGQIENIGTPKAKLSYLVAMIFVLKHQFMESCCLISSN